MEPQTNSKQYPETPGIEPESENDCPPGFLRLRMPYAMNDSEVQFVPVQRIIKTRVMISGKRTPTMCAHYFFNRQCHLGVKCNFVHTMHVDPLQSTNRCALAPPPPEIRNRANREKRSSNVQMDTPNSTGIHPHLLSSGSWSPSPQTHQPFVQPPFALLPPSSPLSSASVGCPVPTPTHHPPSVMCTCPPHLRPQQMPPQGLSSPNGHGASPPVIDPTQRTQAAGDAFPNQQSDLESASTSSEHLREVGSFNADRHSIVDGNSFHTDANLGSGSPNKPSQRRAMPTPNPTKSKTLFTHNKSS